MYLAIAIRTDDGICTWSTRVADCNPQRVADTLAKHAKGTYPERIIMVGQDLYEGPLVKHDWILGENYKEKA